MFRAEQELTEFESGLAEIDFSAEDAIVSAFELLRRCRYTLSSDELIDRSEPNRLGAIKSFGKLGLKSTHFKYWIYGESVHPDDGANVWMHAYTGNELPGELVERPHNHRADIALLIGNGGYRHAIFRPQESGLIAPVYEAEVKPGSIYWLSANEVHSVSEVEPGTITVMIQGRPRRGFSEVYSPDGTAERIPARSEQPDFREYLASLKQASLPHWPASTS